MSTLRGRQARLPLGGERGHRGDPRQFRNHGRGSVVTAIPGGSGHPRKDIETDFDSRPVNPHPALDAISSRRVLASSVNAAFLGNFTAWLTGALAVRIDEDIPLGTARIGLASGSFFLVATLTSALMGRLVERIGPSRAMISAALIAAACLGTISVAPNFSVILIALGCGGISNALGQTGANLLIARSINSAKQGWAYAVKQSGVPAGTLVAGLAVPSFGHTVGWRWAYALAAVLAIGAAAYVPRVAWTAPNKTTRRNAGKRSGSKRADRNMAGRDLAGRDLADRENIGGGGLPWRPLLFLTMAAAAGTLANGSVASFAVKAGVDIGVDDRLGGLLLSAGSALTVIGRLTMGHRADRRGKRHLPVAAGLLLGGSVGVMLMSVRNPATYVVGLLIAMGAGWSWPGLLNLVVVRISGGSPGAATGVTQSGVYFGAFAGPILFGQIADRGGFQAGWLAAALCMLVGALGMLVARAQIRS